jgi:hypothetical protein
MAQFFIVGVVLLFGALGFYKVFIEPRRWMRNHSDGIYNPLRKAYKRAAE